MAASSTPLSERAALRWTALVLVALMMFFAHLFVDLLSPLKTMLLNVRGWDSATYGIYAGSEYYLNFFCFFLIFAGIILDKMGIRFTGLLSAAVMVAGASVKCIGISDWFQSTPLCLWLDSWWTAFPGSAKLATLGFMVFGCGSEMAGTTVSKALAKWFNGKELALAMGTEMSLTRMGVFAAMWISPALSRTFSLGATVTFATALLCIGGLAFSVFCVMDRRLDTQLALAGRQDDSKADEFQVKDLGRILSSKMFWIVAILCTLFYSTIFPFQKFAPEFLAVTLKVGGTPKAQAEYGSRLFSAFPILAMALTPLLGMFLDRKGKGATMLMVGALVSVASHLAFAFLLPAFPKPWLALSLVMVLGVSFSLVPAALWPSVPKIIDGKILGSAYCVIFWVQNLGLSIVPWIIGVAHKHTASYTLPEVLFACLGVAAFFVSIMLKVEDRKKGYGLERPNIQSA